MRVFRFSVPVEAYIEVQIWADDEEDARSKLPYPNLWDDSDPGLEDVRHLYEDAQVIE